MDRGENMSFTETLKRLNAPLPDFWENEVEMGLENMQIRYTQNDFVEDWIEHRTGRQVEILCENLHLDSVDSVQEKRAVVEVGPNVVRIEGEVVVAAQASTRFQVFKILWERFLEDLIKNLPPAEFSAISLDDLISEIENRENKTDAAEMTVRRAINRLQEDIETAVKKKTGQPIDREDIVQTCHWKGQAAGLHGYRLNPKTVGVRPYLTSL